MLSDQIKSEFSKIMHSDSNQPILISSPSCMAAKLLIDEFDNDFNMIRFNEWYSGESIKIDQIRDLTSLSAASASAANNIVVIYNFEDAGREAQNSFLKTLEETVKGTRFILTTKQVSLLLGTVRSRCLDFAVDTSNTQQIVKYITDKQNELELSEDEVTRILKSLNGDVDLTVKSISNEDEYSNYKQALQAAKSLLSHDSEPLAELAGCYKNRHSSLMLLAVMGSIAEHKMTSDLNNARQWASVARKIIKARTAIQNNVNIKSVLSEFVLEL